MKVKPQRVQNSAMVTIPAPVGGWNARDAFAVMPPLDAVELVNWFPKPDRITSRGGHQVFATGLGGAVETMMEWRGPTSRKFKAIAVNTVYDISAGGAAVSDLAGLSSSRFSHTTMTTGAGTYLVMTDGISSVREYDGAAWSVPAITGVTSADLVYVNNYRGRLFFVEKNSMRVWYLDSQAIAGAAKKLDFGRDAKKGGYMVAMGTWLQDSGEGGVDDLAVFVTSEGEVIIYQGSDPSSPTSWAQVGIFQTGKPIGARCLMRYGSDLTMLLQDGFFAISALLKSDVESPALAISDKIRNAFVAASVPRQNTWGWQAIYHPNGQRVVVNVPNDAGGYDQFVQNSISHAWCRFTGLNGTCFGLFNSNLYCGKADGKVYLLDSGEDDVGVPIPLSVRQAFNDLGVPTQEKYAVGCRLKIGINGLVNVTFGLDFDYTDSNLSGSGVALGAGGGTLWDAGLWDISPWSSAELITQPWFTFGGVGRVMSPRIRIDSHASTSWYDTDILAEPGGVL